MGLLFSKPTQPTKPTQPFKPTQPIKANQSSKPDSDDYLRHLHPCSRMIQSGRPAGLRSVINKPRLLVETPTEAHWPTHRTPRSRAKKVKASKKTAVKTAVKPAGVKKSRSTKPAKPAAVSVHRMMLRSMKRVNAAIEAEGGNGRILKLPFCGTSTGSHILTHIGTMRFSLRSLLPVASPRMLPRPIGPSFGPGLFEYTSGRFLFNEKVRLRERYVPFDRNALATAIGAAVNRPVTELLTINKFAEGGFNRVLQATFNDGLEVLARIPFRTEGPLYHSVASEAATLHFLHLHGLPVPKVLGYSPVATNPVGTEYILLAKIEGKPLSEQWFSLEPKPLMKVMKQIVHLEKKIMELSMPASGSLYFRKDLEETEAISVPFTSSPAQDDIVVGPTARYAWWYRERASLEVDRGPWKDFLTCFVAPAKREMAFCDEFGTPRLHAVRYLRELQNFELQQPSHHSELLSDYLKMAPSLDLSPGTRFARPTLRHPDFSPRNILVNDDHDVVGIIDWQHADIVPLCLCAGIPEDFANYGDPISEALKKPEMQLPHNFEQLPSDEQQSVWRLRHKQLVHFFYGALTLRESKDHYDALRSVNAMLRAKIYDRASAPWEGNSLLLQGVMVRVGEQWPLSLEGSVTPKDVEFPVQYSAQQSRTCIEKVKAETNELGELEEMRKALGIDALGWVEDDDHLAKAREMKEAMRTALLKVCDTETERKGIRDHFPFDDHEE